MEKIRSHPCFSQCVFRRATVDEQKVENLATWKSDALTLWTKEKNYLFFCCTWTTHNSSRKLLDIPAVAFICSWLLFLTDRFGLHGLVPDCPGGPSGRFLSGRTGGSHVRRQHGGQQQLVSALKPVSPSIQRTCVCGSGGGGGTKHKRLVRVCPCYVRGDFVELKVGDVWLSILCVCVCVSAGEWGCNGGGCGRAFVG